MYNIIIVEKIIVIIPNNKNNVDENKYKHVPKVVASPSGFNIFFEKSFGSIFDAREKKKY